jgi:hypothetical protein
VCVCVFKVFHTGGLHHDFCTFTHTLGNKQTHTHRDIDIETNKNQ